MTKFQMGLTEAQQNDLELLMEDCGCRSLKSLFNTAFSVLNWIIQTRKKGCKVGFMNRKGNFVELDIKGFPPVRNH